MSKVLRVTSTVFFIITDYSTACFGWYRTVCRWGYANGSQPL